MFPVSTLLSVSEPRSVSVQDASQHFVASAWIHKSSPFSQSFPLPMAYSASDKILANIKAFSKAFFLSLLAPCQINEF